MKKSIVFNHVFTAEATETSKLTYHQFEMWTTWSVFFKLLKKVVFLLRMCPCNICPFSAWSKHAKINNYWSAIEHLSLLITKHVGSIENDQLQYLTKSDASCVAVFVHKCMMAHMCVVVPLTSVLKSSSSDYAVFLATLVSETSEARCKVDFSSQAQRTSVSHFLLPFNFHIYIFGCKYFRNSWFKLIC